jgi:acetyltransferase
MNDASREREFICGLSADSRYSRFMHAIREPSVEFVGQMVGVDYRHTMAFVAVVGEGEAERIIGVARYADSPDGSGCEFAIAVADPWQSRGVGTAIAHRLFDYARTQGVPQLNARILATNSRMVAFAHELGFTTRIMPAEPELIDAQLALAPVPIDCSEAVWRNPSLP